MQKKVKELIVVVLETLLITGVTVFSVLPVSCKFSQSGIHLLGGDYVPPKLDQVVVLDETTLRMTFSEKVQVSAQVFVRDGELFDEEVGTSVVYGSVEKQIDVCFNEPMITGIEYEMVGTVKDNVGNSTTFLIPFVGFNSRVPLIVMTEIQSESVNSQTSEESEHGYNRNEFVEFLVLTDGNLSGLEFVSAYDGVERGFKFPGLEVKRGEILLVHLRKRGNGCVSELGDDLNLSKNSYSKNGIRDLWVTTEETALGNKTDVLVVRNSANGSVIDYVFYRESKVVEWNKKFSAVLEFLKDYVDINDVEIAALADGKSSTKTLNRSDAGMLLEKVKTGFEFSSPLEMQGDNWIIAPANPGTL